MDRALCLLGCVVRHPGRPQAELSEENGTDWHPAPTIRIWRMDRPCPRREYSSQAACRSLPAGKEGREGNNALAPTSTIVLHMVVCWFVVMMPHAPKATVHWLSDGVNRGDWQALLVRSLSRQACANGGWRWFVQQWLCEVQAGPPTRL